MNKNRTFLALVLLLISMVAWANDLLKADFTADESASTYYEIGWDNVEEASTWNYYRTNQSTWTLAENPKLGTVSPFSSIDPESKYSLTIFYVESQQNERAVSPEIQVMDNSTVEFYMAFGGVWLVFADLKFYVNDLTTGTQDELFSAFRWAQANEFTGPSWEKFSFDLSKYAGHKCTFEFIYKGSGGDNMAIDGFKIKRQTSDEDARIVIFEGDQVHFKDLSLGSPTSWNWTAEGPETLTSTEQNPVMTFQKAGKYNVKLVVKKGQETSEAVKTEFVEVTVAAPKAHIGLPEYAYNSPYAFAFVPVGVPMTYKDCSTGNPTSWNWTFEGTDVTASTDQNPTVTYTQEGKFGLELVVENASGIDRDFLVEAVQAGGKQEIWNITPDEIERIGSIQLGWYGSYAGTNYLGMKSFAEKYGKPMTTATVEGVTIYFDAVESESPDVKVTVSLCAPDASGVPGEVLAQAELKASDLQVSKTDILPTKFMFANPVELDGEFFVVIDGMNDVTGYYDNINILCITRPTPTAGTTYHLLEDEDASYNPLGTYTWYKESDEGVSMCVAPIMEYKSGSTSISTVETPATPSSAVIYDISGRRLNELQHGINIVNGKKLIVR